MHTGNYQWSIVSLSVWIGAGVVIFLLLSFAAYNTYKAFTANHRYDRKNNRTIAIFLSIAALVTALIVVGMSFPYSKEYHAYETITGTVAQTDKRLLADGDGMSEKIVVLYEESGQQFGCEDTRCASAKPGDTLTLACKKVWEFNGTDGYDCKFKNLERGG